METIPLAELSPDFLSDERMLFEDDVPTIPYNDTTEPQPDQILDLSSFGLNSPPPEHDAGELDSPQHHDIDAGTSFVRRSTRISASPVKGSKYCDPDDVLDEPPKKRSPRNLRRKIEDHDYDADSDSEDEKSAARARKRPGSSRAAAKRNSRRRQEFKCRFPECKMTFGRKNDAERHSSTAAIHKDARERENTELPPSPSCLKCGKILSRLDAKKRHERDGSCKKVKGDAVTVS
jgi:hypothetical protein